LEKKRPDQWGRNPSVTGVSIPFWQRGIEGDLKIMLIKSPPPLFTCPWQEKEAKEGYKGTFV